MKVITGKYKGYKLFLPLNKNTRPLKSLVKETIFNILSHSNKFSLDFYNKRVLDLFSGSGSFGLECLSRGALNVIFVENNKNALIILKKNIEKLKVQNQVSIFKESVLDYLENSNKKFDLIFLDPPFKEKNFIKLLNLIVKKKLLNNRGIIIAHRHKNSKDSIANKFKYISEKTFGISKIIFFI